MDNPTSSTPTPFILLFRNTGNELFDPLPADARQKLLEDWNTWFSGLIESGKSTEGQPLELDTRRVSGPAGTRVTDGPFPEAKEAVGGYVKLLVASLDEATSIAQQHPALEYGMEIEIRQMMPDCHLGVKARTV